MKRLGLLVLAFFAVGVGVVAPMPWLLGLYAEAPGQSPLLAHLTATFAAERVVFLAHVAGGGLALLTGPWQLMPRLRAAWPRLHRGVGYAYAAAVLVGGAAGLAMGPRAWGGLAAQAGFSALAIAWLLTTAMGVRQIFAGDRERHRAWMTRSFALTFAAVSLRLQIPLMGALGVPNAIAYALVAWTSWLPNLAFVEWRRRPVNQTTLDGTRLASSRSSA